MIGAPKNIREKRHNEFFAMATFKMPTPFASCFRTFRSVALCIFGLPSFTPWATAVGGLICGAGTGEGRRVRNQCEQCHTGAQNRRLR
jgi:hypothetical protein